MKEIRDIIQAYDMALKEGLQTALATVAEVEGSSYRRPGARMLITERGELTGAISGGCLEGDALRKAFQVILEKRSRLVTYDTHDEDDAKLGMGLGCNGLIQVLLEPNDKNDIHNPIELLRTVVKDRSPAVIVTQYNPEDKKAQQPGTCMLLKKETKIVRTTGMLSDQLNRDAEAALAEKKSMFRTYSNADSTMTAFVEYIPAPISLIVIGGGNDAFPLIQLAQMLGWDVTVVDGRSTHAKKARFPAGCQVMLAKPGEVLKGIAIDDQTVFVLMTHNYNYDLGMMRELLRQDVRYIGLLGPEKRRARLIDELSQEGITITESQLSTIHGPVGLDIGAETSEEIALAIVAEIKAVLAGRVGESLRNRTGPIHLD